MSFLFEAIDLNYTINNKKILNNLNFKIPKNKLTCILGKSGSGKTSLISILTGKIKNVNIEGILKFNNNLFDKSLINNISAFVDQNDILSPNLTTYELLEFCVNLKLKDLNNLEKKEKINNLLFNLDLNEQKNVIIGNNEKKGLSGGQKKRLSIALEIINDPNLIFLDEPTSGLDTYNAFNVINILKNMTENNKTIIVILHQPASEIFNLLDNILILDDGNLCYCDEKDNFISYIKNLGFECPIYTNPLDYLFMNLLHTKYNAKTLIDYYNNNQKTNINEINVINEIDENHENNDIIEIKKNTNKQFYKDFKIILTRKFKEIYRNKRSFKVKIIQSIFLAIIIALVFMTFDYSQKSIQNRLGFLFFICIEIFMSSVYSNIHLFFVEKNIFYKEYSSGWYSLLSFYTSKILAELPVSILTSFLLTTIVYFLVGLKKNFVNYIIFIIIIFFCTLCGNAFGILIGTLFSKIELALSASPAIILPILLLSGFFINSSNVPIYLRWIKYLSPIYYSFSSLVQNELSNLNFDCDNSTNDCEYKTGEEVLHDLNLNHENMNIIINIIIMLTIYILLSFFSYIFLKKYIKKSKEDPYKNINNKQINNYKNIRDSHIEINERSSKNDNTKSKYKIESIII